MSHLDHVFLLDSNDQGQSREALFKALPTLSPLLPSDFNFENSYNEIMAGYQFNLRKFLDESLASKTLSNELRI